ncbi:Dyp-type peroxidase protein [Azotobacter vinelandii CA]|uniref:Dyp-type peroxidase protein n=2 Tax=Azotobacter vinelandii TaxID=354 RepID=C1DFU7_AZOVD|nr:Dyp-type peroxidase [Azotobacter vinelandii]ACO76274.1 Dyp-type peroxidase protein [Azotobacter vinelandii DJ]AGK17468.1 Dyp-type peroxidase protein [Azotobacter vinelandii CA]AGK19004.1 Dyp-type peroxidase protein [Azotobacter vinelandii CA6]WKN22062.1 Dyp-type peroxidase [Azotobacter vinelandii]SFX29383.1 putative iron-dependent peroxidase [Azotobacter vinelandii]
MTLSQPGILAAIPSLACHLFFSLESVEELPAALDRLSTLADGETIVVGFGESLLRAQSRHVAGLRVFPVLNGSSVDIPSTQHALWCWLRGEDRGELLQLGRALVAALHPALRLEQSTDAFRYREGHDLTGYEDGSENPDGEEAVAAALVGEGPEGERGSSFAAVQHWVHDLDHFDSLPSDEQDNIVGRRKSDNEELEDAPESAHVKRTAQESFSPEAFVLRRSMPWSDGRQAGLLFLAFGHSLDAFEAQLKRMAGLDDGIVDALFRFSRPISGGYYWCPPVREGRLDLRKVVG